MSRGKNCLPTVSRQFLTRSYPSPKLSPKMPPKLSLPHKRGFFFFFISLKINPAVRIVARQVRGKNCLAAIFAPRHQSVSSGPLGSGRPDYLVAQCSATPATVAATPPCSATPFQTQIWVRHLPGQGGEVRHQNF